MLSILHRGRGRRTPSRLRAGVVLVTAGALLVGLFAWRPWRSDEPAGGGPDPVGSAQAWVTSAGGQDLLRHLPSLHSLPATQPRESGAGPPDEIVVDTEAVTDSAPRMITGFGAALTHSSAYLLEQMSEEARATLLWELFAPSGPTRLSVVRIPLGGSDFVVDEAYTYDDVPAGETDWDLARFTTAVDEPILRSALRDIRALAPEVYVIGSPWSPPAWMKSSGSLEGGQLIDDDRAHHAYADYLLRVLREYDAAGVPIDALTVQNEPQARHPDGYPGMDMPVADQVRVFEELGPLIRDAGLSTALLSYDHNWALHPADAASVPAGRDPEAAFATDMLTSSAARWIDGTAYHCYFGDASAQDAALAIDPDKSIWVTECSGSHGPDDSVEETFAATLQWQARHLLIDPLRHGATGVLTWNLALDPEGGPHVGGCSTCTGVVTLEGDTVTRNAEYYVLAHASRFIPRGSTRVDSHTDADDSLAQVAFRTPGGAIVLLISNGSDQARTVSATIGRHPYEVPLEPRSITTLTWSAATLDHGASAEDMEIDGPLLELELDDVRVTATPEAPDDPCCRDDGPARAVDGDASTRWSSGRPQTPGDHLDLDLGGSIVVRTVILDSGPGPDWPRSWEAWTSTNGREWSGPVAAGRGYGAITAIDLPRETVRHLRIRLREPDASWWSVAEIRALG